MDISIVIVNYNVKYFLEQCLHSVEKAISTISAEVFVVDNNSVDGSCGMVEEKFPWTKLITNKENVGFSKANNQAIRLAAGRYVLLLNPDTVVEETTFEKTIAFMDQTPDSGGLGVKMIDGKGNFLPESKRGIPTPMVAFYKIFGLSKLFPKSKLFSKYHLGYLDKEKTHQVEILSGAFMLMRKQTLDKIGLLDEDYFMYGEDIDLSYRILKGGYKNYYYPGTTIIHYKGESTKKGSINYVLVFYKAMIIFARKQLGASHAKLFSLLINFAIYFRASLSILNRFFKKGFYPFLDFTIILAWFWIIAPLWRENFLHSNAFPREFLYLVVPSYASVWIFCNFFAGGYSSPVNLLKVLRGLSLGFLAILIGYALLNEELRYSRAVLLLAGLLTIVTAVLSRFVLSLSKIELFKLKSTKAKRIVIVGNLEESKRVENILAESEMNKKIIGFVGETAEIPKNFLGSISQLEEIIKIHNVDEIIYCSKNISSKEIIASMLKLSNFDLEYKIAPQESISIIGSNSINTPGDLYTIDFNSIANAENRRMKLFFDLAIAFSALLFFPLIVWFVDNKTGFFKNIFLVIFLKKTWVGYNKEVDPEKYKLPKLKNSILSPVNPPMSKSKREVIDRENILYAKKYTVSTDFTIIAHNIYLLGN